MSIERPKQAEAIEKKEGREKTLKELKNEMQAAMMLHECHMDDYDCHEKWLKKNGDNFHFVFDNISAKYGNMFELWEKDRSATMDHLLGGLRDLDSSDQRRAA